MKQGLQLQKVVVAAVRLGSGREMDLARGPAFYMHLHVPGR